MGNTEVREILEDYIINYQNFNDFKLITLYDYYSPKGIISNAENKSKFKFLTFPEILDDCLTVYLLKIQKEIDSNPLLYSVESFQKIQKLIQEPNFQENVINDRFSGDEVGFESYKAWFTDFLKENDRILLKKKKIVIIEPSAKPKRGFTFNLIYCC
jgi:hypothetical protein